ncbi:MAG: 4-oxalocrotonate tautomerase family protein [Azospirillaceae bacterium]
MPLVRITMVEGRSVAQKEAAAKAVTQALVEHCDAHQSHVYVIFDDVADTDWTVGGETVAERRRQRGET